MKMSKRKAPSSENNPNHDFCDFLTELADYEKNVSRNIFKYKAYRKAASILSNYPTRIASGKEARKLNGIGDKISKKIDEFLQTGKLKKLETIHTDSSSTAITLLTRVFGIGPAKAQKLVSEGITSIAELRKHPEKLTQHQVTGLKYFEDFEKKIPRSEIEAIEQIMKKALKKLDKKYILTICGSYRRGKSESGDIDALITHTEADTHNKTQLKCIVDKLVDCGLITETLSLGETKFMGACKLNNDSNTRRLDIRLTPHEQYFCSVLYFTGSDMFNQEMRAHAQENGFTLNEYSLRPVGSTGVPGEAVPISSEQDIFDYIDFPYKEPHERSK